MEYFDPDPQGLSKCFAPDRHDHEFLHVHVVGRVGPAIQDVHHGHGEAAGVGPPDISVERHEQGICSRPCNGHGNAQDGVGPQLALVGGPVQFDQCLVNETLIHGLHVNKCGRDDPVHVFDCIFNPLAAVSLFPLIS